MAGDESTILVRFGERLRDLRKAAGFTQEGFALECQLDRSYVGAVERGERNLSLCNIYKMANKLNLSLSALWPRMTLQGPYSPLRH